MHVVRGTENYAEKDIGYHLSVKEKIARFLRYSIIDFILTKPISINKESEAAIRSYRTKKRIYFDFL